MRQPRNGFPDGRARAGFFMGLLHYFCACVSSTSPSVTLYNGVEMPIVAAGTAHYVDDEARDAVLSATSAGILHLDTADNYGDQVGVGAGIQDSGVPRERLFVTSKISGCGMFGISRLKCKQDSAKAILATLSELRTSYLDLLLVHFPPPGGCGPLNCAMIRKQWEAVEEAYATKKMRAIGVSNWCKSCFKCLNATMKVKPMVNQLMYHVGMGTDPRGLRSYCQTHGVVMQAYSPLGNKDTSLIKSPLLKAIGAAHNRSSVQVALKWVWTHGVPLVVRSSNPAHLAQDADLFGWELTESEVQQLDAETTPSGEPSMFCKQ